MPIFAVYEFAFACCSVASFALLIWDHIVCLKDEIRHIWQRTISGGTVLYCFLRYGTLLEKIAIMLLASWYMTPRGCDAAVRFHIFPVILRQLGFGLFSGLRVYALTHKNWFLGLLCFALCLPGAITPSYVYVHQHAQGVSRFGCQLAYTASQTAHVRLRISAIVAEILAEIMVIVVTFVKAGATNRILQSSGSSKSGNTSVSRLLLRGGLVYFCALLIMSLADMLVLILDHVPQNVVGYNYWVVPYYTPVFRTMILCRFMYRLRAVSYGDEGDNDTGTRIAFSSRVIGSMAAPLEPLQFGTLDPAASFDSTAGATLFARDPFVAGILEEENNLSKSVVEEKGKQKEGIELSEFPWAAGLPENREEGPTVQSTP